MNEHILAALGRFDLEATRHHLAALDAGLSRFELAELSHAMLAASIQRPHEMAAFLDSLDGLPEPVAQRTRIQALDAIWRSDLPSTEKRRRIAAKVAARSDPGALLYQGAELLLSGQRLAAFELYRQAAATAIHGLPRAYHGAHSVGNAAAPAPPGVVSRITWVRRKYGKKAPVTVLMGCDKGYFLKFAPHAANNLLKIDPDAHLHFHVVNWDEECAALFAVMYPKARMSVSSEPYRYVQDRTYFATVRFFRAAAIMEALGTPLYITDIDNRFIGAPSALPLKAYHAGFRSHENGLWFPWWGPSGGNLWLNSQAVADMLAGYIRERFRPNEPLSWWFDQLALNEVQHHADMAGYRLVNLAGPLHVSTTRPVAEIVHLKGRRA